MDERQPSGPLQGTAFALRDPYPWSDLAELAGAGEALGYRALFLPEVGARDTLAALTGLAGATSSLLLGTGVVPVPSRSPALLAMAAATVQERSGGRLVLGLGTGPALPGALDRLRMTVAMLRRAFTGERVEMPDGTSIRLGLVPEQPPAIWIAALGPKAVWAAGEVADGVILNWCTPARVEEAAGRVAEAAAAADRDPAGITVAVYVRACVLADEDAALAAAASFTGEYASYPAYARQFAAMGFAHEAELAAAAHAAGRPQDVPAALVRAVCLVGEAPAARERLEAFRVAGAHLPVVYPVVAPGDPLAAQALGTLSALAPSGRA